MTDTIDDVSAKQRERTLSSRLSMSTAWPYRFVGLLKPMSIVRSGQRVPTFAT